MSSTYYAEKLSADRLRKAYDLATPRVRRYLEAEIDHVLGFLRPGDRVLELGCGYGRVLARLADKAGRAYGIDNSLTSLALAGKSGRELDLAVMDAACLGFRDNSFDLVACVQNGISAFKVEPKRLLTECIRVTSPGGRVLFSSYAADIWQARLEWFSIQADHGLLGEIDFDATGNGVIICKDGFKATTFSENDFKELAMACGVKGNIRLVDESSLFMEITVP